MADPHVISALRSKRAELSGELIDAEQRIVQLRSDIASLDGAIRVFDPSAAPDKIRPILRRKKPTLIPRGRCSRAVLDTLRDANAALTVREIAAQLAVERRTRRHAAAIACCHCAAASTRKIRRVDRETRWR